MMENLGIILPEEIQMLLAKKNSLLDDIMRVKNMIDKYNSFILSMNNLEVSIEYILIYNKYMILNIVYNKYCMRIILDSVQCEEIIVVISL